MNQRARIKNILTSSTALIIYAGFTTLLLALVCIRFSKLSAYISIWPVNAVLLIFIFRSEASLSWAYFGAGLIANIAANFIMGAPMMMAAAFALCNCIEVLIPMLSVSRKNGDQYYIHAMDRETFMLTLSLPIACLISAALATALNFNLFDPKSIPVIFNWFTIDLLAMMAILPLGLSATNVRVKKLFHPKKLFELIIVMAAAMTITIASMQYTQIRFIIILMPLLYAAYRLGLFGTSLIFFSTVAIYVSYLIIFGIGGTPYSSMPELISYSSLLMCITLIPALIIAILIDQRDDYENQLKESEERFRGAIKYSAIGMALVSPTGKWLTVNPALCALAGYTENELYNLKLTDLTYPDDTAIDAALIKQVVSRNIPSYFIEKRVINKNGEVIWILLTVSAVFNQQNKLVHFVVQIENINERKMMETELKHQASHDVLTGLINRREIESKIQILIEDARKYINTNSLFFIDLDNFKTVNDTAGHAAGDELLKKVAELFTKSVRTTDIVARLGGDEFAVILPECTMQNAATIANTLIENIKNFRFDWAGKTYPIGASIGLVTFKAGQTTLKNLLSQADIACYTAKSQGGNCVKIFEGERSDASKFLADIQIGPRIKKYIHDNLFRIYAQEIKPLQNTANPSCFDITLRMKDDSGKIIPPDVLADSVERVNLTTEVDQWLVKHILLDRPEVISSSEKIIVCINISAKSITSSRFQKTLDQYLQQTNINKAKIGFQIRESAFLENKFAATNFLSLMTKHHCFICLDSIGKGLITLKYLEKLPRLLIKIDGDFISEIDANPTERTLVKSINQLIHDLGAQSIAVNVDTHDLTQAARAINIDYAQGLAITEAVPLNEIIV